MTVTHKVRVVTLEGNPWFVAADVCRVLGIYLGPRSGTPNVTLLIQKLASDETQFNRIKLEDRAGRSTTRNMVLVSEAGLYKLIMRSDKPTAAPFQDWVTREVLPSIRKTGEFKMQPGEAMPLPASFADALRQHATTLIRLAEEQEAHAQTKAEVDAARATKAQAEAEVSRLEPMAAAVGAFDHKVQQFARTLP